jgi:chromosome segregation ATPase
VELDDCQEYIQTMTAKNSQLQDQVESLSAAAAQQTQTASAMQEANEKSELLLEAYGDLSRINSEKTELEARVAVLQQQLNEARQGGEVARAMSASAESGPKGESSDDKEGVKKDREISSLKSQIKKLRESEAQFEAALQKSVNEKEGLLSAKVKSESEVRLGKDKIQKLKAALAASKQELTQLKETVGGLEGIDAYKDLLQSKLDLERDLAALKEESDVRLREHKVASVHLVSLMSEKTDLQKQLEAAQNSLAAGDSEKSNRKRELSSLRDETYRLEQLVRKLEVDVASGQAAQEDKARLEKSIASLQDEKNRMVNKVLGLHNENSELKQKTHSSQAELTRLQKSFQALTERAAELEARCEVMAREKAEAALQLESTYTSKVEALLTDTSRLRAATQTLEVEKETMEANVSALEASNVDLEKRVRGLVAELSDSKKDTDTVVQEREASLARLKDVEGAKARLEAAYAVLNAEVAELRNTVQELHGE